MIVPVCAILALAGLALLGTPIGQAAAAAALGQCSNGQVREGEHFQDQMGKVRASISEGSHKLREDGKYQLGARHKGSFGIRGQ